MQKLFTFVLLFTVVAAQLFGSSAVTELDCAEANCQCSIEAKAEGNCCCSANTSECCASKERASCCGGPANKSASAPTICTCGCQHSSTPVPAQTESSPSELYRLLCSCSATVRGHDSVVQDGTLPVSVTRSTDSWHVPSSQPLYCCWLI